MSFDLRLTFLSSSQTRHELDRFIPDLNYFNRISYTFSFMDLYVAAFDCLSVDTAMFARFTCAVTSVNEILLLQIGLGGIGRLQMESTIFFGNRQTQVR